MSDALLQQLTACDERTPPPAGQPITAQRLQQRLRQRRARTIAAAGLLTFAASLPFVLATLAPAPAPAAIAELDELERGIDDLLAQLSRPPVRTDDTLDLAFELAYAHTLTLAPRTPGTNVSRTATFPTANLPTATFPTAEIR